MKNKFAKVTAALLAALLVFAMIPLTALAREKVDVAPVQPKTAAVKTQEKATEKKTKEHPPFDFKAEDIAGLYKAQSGKFVVTPILNSEENFEHFVNNINAIKNVDGLKSYKWDHDEAAKSLEASFIVVYKNGQRAIYSLNKNNILQAGDLYYVVPENIYNNLLTVFNTQYKVPSFAQWLIYMQPGKIKNITVKDTVDRMAPAQIGENYLSQGIQQVRGLRVVAGDYYFPARADFVAGNGTAHVQVVFDNDEYYDLWIQGDKLFIQSSELRFGCEYTLASGDGARLVAAIKNPAEAYKAA